MSTKSAIDDFLNRHPEVLVGREALEDARSGVADPGNTFDIINRPLAGVVLHQQFDADTKKRLWAVALVNDERAEKYCQDARAVDAGGDDDKSEDAEQSAQSRNPDDYLYESAPPQLRGAGGERLP